MKCPYCGHLEDKVVDSREGEDGETVRRRRECLQCTRRFTTYERSEKLPLMVVKKDGRREPFDRQKLLAGLRKACEKRPVSMEQLDRFIDDLERDLVSAYEKEAASAAIGELVMERLHGLDEVAYVRFASVYRQFKDINQFMGELKGILDQRGGPPRSSS